MHEADRRDAKDTAQALALMARLLEKLHGTQQEGNNLTQRAAEAAMLGRR